MKAKIRTCPFDNCPCELSCPDRHPDRSGCKLTDTLDAGQDALVFNNPPMTEHPTRAELTAAIAALLDKADYRKLRLVWVYASHLIG